MVTGRSTKRCSISRSGTKQRGCWMRKASSDISSLLWTNSGPDAGWRRTRFTHSSYLAVLAAAGCAAPVLMAIVFGFRLEGVMVDVLQKVDFGAASHIIGNVLWLRAVKRRISGGDTMKARVESLHQPRTSGTVLRSAPVEFRVRSRWTRSAVTGCGRNSERRRRQRGTWLHLRS